MAIIEKSPSFYNVMSFLDSLSNIQTETVTETHTARLHNYPYCYQQPQVYHQTEIWYETYYEKPSCLRKVTEEAKHAKHKKVSFLEANTEHKGNQVTLCPFHKAKTVRISSQQFPPVENAREEGDETLCKGDHAGKTNTGCGEHCSSVSKANVNKVSCEIHGDIEATLKVHRCEAMKKPVCLKQQRNNKYCCGNAGSIEVSSDDKSTQVFCQIKASQNSIQHIMTEEHVGTAKDEQHQTTELLEENNADASKSTSEHSSLDPFFDYSNESTTTKDAKEVIDNKITHAQSQPKVVVFREVVEDSNFLQPLKNIDVEQYKKRLEKRKELRLRRRSSTELVKSKVPKVRNETEGVMFLKSFYAIFYILMFTALSLDYRCL